MNNSTSRNISSRKHLDLCTEMLITVSVIVKNQMQLKKLTIGERLNRLDASTQWDPMFHLQRLYG